MYATNFERITVNPNQMDGVPCIRGLRIPVFSPLVRFLIDNAVGALLHHQHLQM